MRKYSREERYRSVESMGQDYFDKQRQKVQSDSGFYPHFHIAPPYGLLNDSNGLAEFNGEHHIFYQYHPVAPTHGLKYWYHLSTKDFVSYKDWGIALYPDTESDSHGVYSGGALVKGDELVLFYTGNKYDDDWIRTPSQSIAVMNKDGKISEKTQIIPCDSAFTEHFRDPKPWQAGSKYYLIVGAQTQGKKGCLVLYRSDYINKNWEKVGIIQTVFNVDELVIYITHMMKKIAGLKC